jgi:hypothetical protein
VVWPLTWVTAATLPTGSSTLVVRLPSNRADRQNKMCPTATKVTCSLKKNPECPPAPPASGDLDFERERIIAGSRDGAGRETGTFTIVFEKTIVNVPVFPARFSRQCEHSALDILDKLVLPFHHAIKTKFAQLRLFAGFWDERLPITILISNVELRQHIAQLIDAFIRYFSSREQQRFQSRKLGELF